jgi:hypothetical protein
MLGFSAHLWYLVEVERREKGRRRLVKKIDKISLNLEDYGAWWSLQVN